MTFLILSSQCISSQHPRFVRHPGDSGHARDDGSIEKARLVLGGWELRREGASDMRDDSPIHGFVVTGL
jgi:hypothetical protein